ncbi:MAG: molecular chaperone DnaK [Acidobacteriota bacterium]|jgi:molecular chaperone DnaK|nr:molecular chaperone DnaK [Acidobacteriota bacterium]
MPRKFVDYGIDLGTTNSCIAVFEGGEVEVVKNNEESDYTPSAFYFDEDGAQIVGRGAWDNLDSDPENAASEFKLQMGTEWKKSFARNGRRMSPEELSAQVLMSLKENCRQRKDEEVSAAVISVPAAFNSAKSEATREAARIAGISYSPLVQEPVAAAWAYGFQREAHKTFWLVYDLGGGTFDAAIVKSHDGIVQVVDNGGDEHLGGKLIDWAIVEELLIPEVKSKAGLTDFERGNPRWLGAVAKLKGEAERAKIRLSRDPSYKIETYLQSGDGRVVPFEYRLQKQQVEQLAEQYIRKTIVICKKILSSARLRAGDIEKVLLVGGPTLMPYLRDCLADTGEGLGIPLEFGFDPMTVVAKGAAIYAATYENPVTTPNEPKPGDRHFHIALNYRQLGSDPEPLVGGKVTSPAGETDFSGYNIEFISSGARLPWATGKKLLSAEGKFSARLHAPDKQNTFLIALTDPQGGKVEVKPDSLSYTLGIDDIEAPLTHSIGVALGNNTVERFFEKGSPQIQQPKRRIFNSAYFFSKEKEGVALRIPIIEGEYDRADRNDLIGHIEATAQQIRRDIHAGEDVEVELRIDESRLLSVKVFMAALHEEITAALDLRPARLSAKQLGEQALHAAARLEKLKEMALDAGDPESLSLLSDVDKDGIMKEVAGLQKAADTDPSARDELEKRLRELNVRLDKTEVVVKIPWLVLLGQGALAGAQRVVEKSNTDLDKLTFRILQRELLSAMRERVVNPAELDRKISMMNAFAWEVWRKLDPLGALTFELDQLQARDLNDYANLDQARELIVQARKAVHNNEFEKLETAVRQLWQLLPSVQPQMPDSWGSTLLPKIK